MGRNPVHGYSLKSFYVKCTSYVDNKENLFKELKKCFSEIPIMQQGLHQSGRCIRHNINKELRGALEMQHCTPLASVAFRQESIAVRSVTLHAVRKHLSLRYALPCTFTTQRIVLNKACNSIHRCSVRRAFMYSPSRKQIHFDLCFMQSLGYFPPIWQLTPPLLA